MIIFHAGSLSSVVRRCLPPRGTVGNVVCELKDTSKAAPLFAGLEDLDKSITACLDEGLYPAWDAANKMSVRLAEKLGYEYSREYVCFSIE